MFGHTQSLGRYVTAQKYPPTGGIRVKLYCTVFLHCTVPRNVLLVISPLHAILAIGLTNYGQSGIWGILSEEISGQCPMIEH